MPFSLRITNDKTYCKRTVSFFIHKITWCDCPSPIMEHEAKLTGGIIKKHPVGRTVIGVSNNQLRVIYCVFLWKKGNTLSQGNQRMSKNS